MIETKPKKGDHITVDVSWFPLVEHHGIYVGDNYVIHFSKEHFGATPVIDKTRMEDFAKGRLDKVIIVPHPVSDSLSPDQVMERAEKLLMLRENPKLLYQFREFNCEHFANLCKTGHPISKQVDNAEHTSELSSPFLKVLAAIGLAVLGESL